MRIAEPLAAGWKAELWLQYRLEEGRSVLAGRRFEGPLAVQKPLYPEGGEVCHTIVVHPPGGIAGGDELALSAAVAPRAAALLTTPGAAKWYRSAGPRSRQSLRFEVEGALEWLPQEAIVFDGAQAEQECEISLAPAARYIGWDIVCLGRAGSGERFTRGRYRFETRLRREGRLLWLERGRIDGGGRLLGSPAGLAGATVFGTLVAAAPALDQVALDELRAVVPEEGRGAVTRLPGVLLARYLGDASEAARHYFRALWRLLRPALAGRAACEPRIWST
jgi:urease accessory protein